MTDMKPSHAAAFALVVWYLMRPPLPHLNPHAVHKDTAGALRGWKRVGELPYPEGMRGSPRQPMGTVRRLRRPAPERKIANDRTGSTSRVRGHRDSIARIRVF